MRRGSKRRSKPSNAEAPNPTLFRGGRYQPLTDNNCTQIIDAAFAILNNTGISSAPEWLSKLLLEHGAEQRDDGRITFGQQVVERALKQASHRVSLPGFDENLGIDIGNSIVHIGTGGAAVQTLDATSGDYRDSTLIDLYKMMRVLNHCDSVHYGIRRMIARDMQTPLDLDTNTAYACLRATSKPIGISFDNAAHVENVTGMFDIALGGENSFRKQPFCFAVIVHIVSPLCFAGEGVDLMRTAIEQGMPLQICTAGQAGATSPAPLAGALAQGLAESIAGAMVVDAIKPGHPCIYAFMPFISDLRTGANNPAL